MNPASALVSIIIPCYNEERTISFLLKAVHDQTYPRSKIEVIIADGLSSDKTKAVVAEFIAQHADLHIRVVENENKTIPSGLNRALDYASGDIVIRLDAHCIPANDYVERCVELHQENKAENIGGVWDIQPGRSNWIARGIAAAASSPLGVGDALYRYSNTQGFVDTVPFGSYRKSLFEKIGKFDENLLANEDYEFNTRIRKSGGRIWLDPLIRSVYFSRPGLGSLMLQYWRYGFWKLRMLQRYPDTLRVRQAVPPIFILGLCFLILLSFFSKQAGFLLVSLLVIYFFALFTGSIIVAKRKKDPSLVVGMPISATVMHVSWGTGFIISLLTSLFSGTIRSARTTGN